MTQNTGNPLSQHFRQLKKYVSLPSSGGNYLSNDVISYEGDKKEVGIRPMTAADEMMFKNPDALLNGEAINTVIRSCAPSIKEPKKLLTNDIDTLVVAIYLISQGKEYELNATCPNEECSAENNFVLDLENILNEIELLDESYPVNLSSGLTAFVSPHTYEMTLKAISLTFEQSKFIESIESSSIDEITRLKHISNTISKVSKLNFDLISDSVLRIVKEEDGIDVTDRKHIREFIENIELKDAKAIEKEIRKINDIGLLRKFAAKCETCEHEWEARVDYNPTDFFTDT